MRRTDDDDYDDDDGDDDDDDDDDDKIDDNDDYMTKSCLCLRQPDKTGVCKRVVSNALCSYQLMTSCWAANPEDRPSFTDLRNDLEKMLEADDELYISVNCDDFDYYSTLANNATSSSEDEDLSIPAMSTEAHPFV